MVTLTKRNGVADFIATFMAVLGILFENRLAGVVATVRIAKKTFDEVNHDSRICLGVSGIWRRFLGVHSIAEEDKLLRISAALRNLQPIQDAQPVPF